MCFGFDIVYCFLIALICIALSILVLDINCTIHIFCLLPYFLSLVANYLQSFVLLFWHLQVFTKSWGSRLFSDISSSIASDVTSCVWLAYSITPVISCVLCNISVCYSSVTPVFSSVSYCGITGSSSSWMLISVTWIALMSLCNRYCNAENC